MRCSHLNRALWLNQITSVAYGFPLFPQLSSFVLVGKSASEGAVFWTLVLWRWKFRELPQSIFG
ncbi:hypothetical protein [Vibrio parahaemolyticus]|uniref:hypothetical protein n=1 Tax=Vibrio parahaemolyticus TaxID=670 RepID=UPI0009F02752|nr:hypothetical protein EN01_023675 [Vibrio parahaemolyticus]